MTRKFIFAAGVASLALAQPALAERGGRGADKGERGGQQSEQRAPERAREQARPERAERFEARQQQRVERPQVQRFERQSEPRIERRAIQRAERRIEQDRPRFERRAIERAERRMEQGRPRFERRAMERAERRMEQDRPRLERRVKVERLARSRDFERAAERALERRQRPAFAGTPQGLPHLLGRHDMRPLDQQQRRDSRRLASIGDRFVPSLASAPVPAFYRSRYSDTPQYYYRYDDDYGTLYRVNRSDSLVSAMFPLFGGYGIGDPWPSAYSSSYVPMGYQGYYYDTPDYYYRNDGYGIYQLDAKTQLITGLVALLTGNAFNVGQRLPATYSAYNVPYAYRSNYYDSDDAWYRYGDGFIYRVDPYSRVIEDRYPLYGDSYNVGQPWPVAYPDYNVPYAYRSDWYDTPQYQYRYANNGIYQVDPKTQLITALVSLVTGQRFAVGQPMPAGYGAYNLPYAYRDDYSDTDDDWYRYANGTIYRIDADSGLIEEAYPAYA